MSKLKDNNYWYCRCGAKGWAIERPNIGWWVPPICSQCGSYTEIGQKGEPFAELLPTLFLEFDDDG